MSVNVFIVSAIAGPPTFCRSIADLMKGFKTLSSIFGAPFIDVNAVITSEVVTPTPTIDFAKAKAESVDIVKPVSVRYIALTKLFSSLIVCRKATPIAMIPATTAPIPVAATTEVNVSIAPVKPLTPALAATIDDSKAYPTPFPAANSAKKVTVAAVACCIGLVKPVTRALPASMKLPTMN